MEVSWLLGNFSLGWFIHLIYNLICGLSKVAAFAWVGDEDVFSLLYNPEQDLALKVGIDLSAPTQSLGKEFASAAGKISDIAKLKDLKMLKDIASGKKLGKKVSKLQSLKGTPIARKILKGMHASLTSHAIIHHSIYVP